MKVQWDIADIDALSFYQLVAEECGPGKYNITFRQPKGTLLTLADSDKPETYKLKIEGDRKKPKSTEAKAAKAEKADSANAGMLKMYEMIFQGQQKREEVLMQHLLATQSGGGFSDAVGVIKSTVDLVEGLDRRRAPVSATGAKTSALEKIAEGLGNAILPHAANLIAGAAPGAPAGLPPADNSNVIQLPQRQEGMNPQAGFAGAAGNPAPTDQASALSRQADMSAPDPTATGALTPEEIGTGAITKMRGMIQRGAPSEQIASEFVDTVCLCEGARCINGQWEITIPDPAAAFDKWSRIIPEFAADPEFSQRCRQDFINIVTEYRSDEQQADERQETVIDAVYDSTVAEEASEESEATEDDSRPLDSGSDEGTDQESQDDG